MSEACKGAESETKPFVKRAKHYYTQTARLLGTTGILLAMYVVGANGQSGSLDPRRDLSPTEAKTISNIVLVEYLTPKKGERQADPYAAAIIALGREGAPPLADAVLNTNDSKYFYLFQYKVGDIAHALLCDIYRDDPMPALLAQSQALRGPKVDYTFQDYVAFVNTSEGRKQLQIAWKRIIQNPPMKDETNANNWYANVSKLDEGAKHGDAKSMSAASTLTHDLKRFYELLRDKQWQETYDLHAKAFREDMLESHYLAEAKRAEKQWGLVGYDVLSVEFRQSPNSTNIDEAIVICKFTELPGYAVSYSTVWWHKEEGVWKCLSAGPHKLSIFREIASPSVDWR